MENEFIFFQIRTTNEKTIARGWIPLPERSHHGVLLVREMYSLGYIPIIRWSDGRNEEEYKRLVCNAPMRVSSHITTDRTNGFCIPDSPSLGYAIYLRDCPQNAHRLTESPK